MAFDNIKKLHAHFSFLAEGKFNERNFDYEIKAAEEEDNGTMRMGKMGTERIALIRSDAQRHLMALEEKFPELAKKEEVKEEVKATKKVSKKE